MSKYKDFSVELARVSDKIKQFEKMCSKECDLGTEYHFVFQGENDSYLLQFLKNTKSKEMQLHLTLGPIEFEDKETFDEHSFKSKRLISHEIETRLESIRFLSDFYEGYIEFTRVKRKDVRDKIFDAECALDIILNGEDSCQN